MTQPAPSLDALVTCLSELLEHTTAVWDRYQQNGPGRLESDLFQKVEGAARRLEQLLGDPQARDSIQATGLDRGEIEGTIRQTTELARRCACTPQGLCFISGEAGLIPRRDQHEAFDTALERLRQSVQQLRQSLL